MRGDSRGRPTYSRDSDDTGGEVDCVHEDDDVDRDEDDADDGVGHNSCIGESYLDSDPDASAGGAAAEVTDGDDGDVVDEEKVVVCRLQQADGGGGWQRSGQA